MSSATATARRETEWGSDESGSDGCVMLDLCWDGKGEGTGGRFQVRATARKSLRLWPVRPVCRVSPSASKKV
ncbi:hypothetical protein BXU09_17365 [Deinococcus sp. LM3]|nr:hypothetical protein BXU09_17365 [Deinococcus sp. LM3]